MKKRYLISLIGLALFACSICVVRGQETPQRAIQEAAEAWMPLWDSGKYDESYDALAEKTKNSITKRQWFLYWNGTRKPLGQLKSRKLVGAKYIKALPGAPDKEGAVLKYESSFKNKESIVETVGMMREKDGTWRVSNYVTK